MPDEPVPIALRPHLVRVGNRDTGLIFAALIGEFPGFSKQQAAEQSTPGDVIARIGNLPFIEDGAARSTPAPRPCRASRRCR